MKMHLRQSALFAAITLMAVLGLTGCGRNELLEAKVGRAVEQATKWTPENIEKDPKGYLYFCEQEIKKTIGDLKASEIAISQNRARILSMQEDAEKKIRVGKQALSELKQLYLAAEDNGQWPITWKDTPRDKTWTQRQIVGLDRQVTQQQKMVATCGQQLRKCDAKLADSRRLSSDAKAKLPDVKIAQQDVEVGELSDGLDARLRDMSSALAVLTKSVDNLGGDIALDSLAEESSIDFSAEEFQAVMNK